MRSGLLAAAPARSQHKALHQAFTNCSSCFNFLCLNNIPGRSISPTAFLANSSEEPILPWLACHGLLDTTATCATCGEPKRFYNKRSQTGLYLWYFRCGSRRCGSRRCGKTSMSCRSGIWAQTSTAFRKMLAAFIAIVLGDPVANVVRNCGVSKKTVTSFAGLAGETCNLSNSTDRRSVIANTTPTTTFS
ncbi:hypothetical protein Pmar_PMAR015468 [Perkinsus marinus ATCC 50983]|uniref:Uncharacterized protein n=1 Tax=Perkinsus marinus (strain ATCC 50983 / TXsc) TaxID=423536 RepID=C5L899_PERM5|nr:hypothetical protein Pmar_PMAR015468 [Perkinsus marinus ATCC 50983]EER07055.1 hypothetical protein Pmar_PMAR015468 [Perkinsus marinus ATCC 50983]|eukprot:XP_002775239.1 hypothetical protein Pmar_PMAR015468 [Perkinsus marinus ATCC 50983]